jgi:pimeloyl-ACP methyl ester carboxylesterase
MFGPIIPRLAEAHQVIAVDLQAHGRTADADRPIALETMGDDIAALVGHLGVGRPDVMGYSLGGGVAFQMALRHPGLVRKLVVVSVYLRSDAAYEAMRSQQGQLSGAAAPMMRETPMYELYQRVAPRPEDFPRLLDKMGAWMAEDFDFSDQFRALQVPTLIVAADADMFPPSHAVEAFELLGGGQRDGGWMGEGRPAGGHALAILPGLQHYTIFASPLLAETALAFLDAPEGQPN